MLQSHNNQNCVVLAWKQIHGPMEQSRELGNKSAHMRSADLQQGCQEHTMGKGWPLQQQWWRRDAHKQKSKIAALSHTADENHQRGLKT